jgi:hypothetical protein
VRGQHLAMVLRHFYQAGATTRRGGPSFTGVPLISFNFHAADCMVLSVRLRL